jgi:adenylate cyclase
MQTALQQLNEAFKTEGIAPLEMRSPLEPMTDLKIQINFCTEAHCFEPIYAKVLNTQDQHPPNIYHLKITAMAQQDRAVIDQWVGQMQS